MTIYIGTAQVDACCEYSTRTIAHSFERYCDAWVEGALQSVIYQLRLTKQNIVHGRLPRCF